MIITRYLTREIGYAALTVTGLLLLIFLSQQVVRYLNYAAIGKIPVGLLLQLVSFEIPYLLALLLPLSLYLAVLLAYGRLYADREMSILQMCGFGQWQLIKVVAGGALFAAGVVLILMLWVNPLISAKRQQAMTSDEATVHLVQTLIPGRFQVSPDGRHMMYAEKLSRNHQRAENIFLAQQKKNPHSPDYPTWQLVLAEEGYQIKDKETADSFFVAVNGYRYEGVPGHNDYKIVQFKKYGIRIPQNNPHVLHQENEALSSWQLWQAYDQPKKAAELQWRVSIALSTFLLALLAVPLSSVRLKRGRYWILFPAVLIYVVYINLLFLARHWVEQGRVPIAMGIWWVPGVALALIVALYGIRVFFRHFR